MLTIRPLAPGQEGGACHAQMLHLLQRYHLRQSEGPGMSKPRLLEFTWPSWPESGPTMTRLVMFATVHKGNTWPQHTNALLQCRVCDL